MNSVARLFFSCGLVALAFIPMARAQDWPPVHAEERGNSQTTTVLGVPFTTGYFSYWIRAYRADKVHYTKSNYLDSWEWRRGVGPDGVITSSPEKLAVGVAYPALSSGTATRGMDAAPIPPSRSVPLPPLPPLPKVTPLSQIRPLTPLPSGALPTLPPLPRPSGSLPRPSGSLPPIPRLNP